jgi:phage FluMu gp28-like protein
MFISTPKGRNWFWRLYLRGQDDSKSSWRSWSFPTSANPYIETGEIEAAREQLPEATFKQEYLAEFIEDAGLVFRNISECVAGGPGAPDPNRRYVMGVDWAQMRDFTVLIVMEVESKRVCEIDRFNQIGWEIQRARLGAMAQRWNVAKILAEHNSIGGPNIEQLQSEGLPVKGFQTTNQSKQDVMVALQLAFERGEIGIPNDDVLMSELQAFEAERLPSGRWRYSAPEGMHDDTVIALALALEAANRPVGLKVAQAGNLYQADQRRSSRRSGGLYGSRRKGNHQARERVYQRSSQGCI